MKTLLAVANPFIHLDEEGVPCGAFPFDPEHAAGARRWVGATIDATRTVVRKRTDERFRAFGGRQTDMAPVQRTFFAYDLEPQKVLDNQHYRQAFAQGDLFPADEQTAREIGCQKFEPPSEALRRVCAATVAVWEREHGGPPRFEAWPANVLKIHQPARSATSTAVEAGSEVTP